jgi:hypothetical protein
MLDDTVVQEVREAFRGHLVRPGDATYDGVRQVWNGMIDRRPR